MSNVGQVALTIVGAVIGLILAPYTGGSSLMYALYGAEAGFIASTFLFPTQLPGAVGPRLTDHMTTTSSVGDPVIVGYGTFASTGTVMFLDVIVEHSQTTTQGGKGAPQQSQTTYTYTQSIGIGLCEGPILDVSRIWENGELVFDKRGIQPGETTVQYAKRLRVSSAYAATMVLYLGDETQLPDPTIELQQGVGNTPYYRGLAYIVYPNRKLRNDQGLRHPTFKFEVIRGGALQNGAFAPVWLNNTLPTSWNPNMIAVDWVSGKYYIVANWDAGAGTISGFYILGNREFVRRRLDTLGGGTLNIGGYGLAISPDSNVLFCAFTSLNYGTLWKLSPIDLSTIASSAPTFPGASLGWTRFSVGSVLNYFGNLSLYLTAVIPVVSQDHVAIISGTSVFANLTFSGRKTQVTGTGAQLLGQPLFYITADNTTNVQIYEYVINLTFAFGLPIPIPALILKCTITPDMVDSSWASFNSGNGGPAVHDLAYSPDGSVIFGVAGTSSTYRMVKVNLATGTVAWVSSTGFHGGSTTYSDSVVSNNRVLYLDNGYSYSTSSGAATALPIHADLDALYGIGLWTTFGATPANASLGEGVMMTSHGPTVFLIDHIGQGNVPVADIIQDLCTRSGLYDVGYSADTDSITTTIPGFSIATTPMTARDTIVPLRSVAFFDSCESGDVIRFVARGGPVTRALVQSDLGAYESGTTEDPNPANVVVIAMESDLPQQIRVAYTAVSRDYQPGQQLSPARYDTKSGNLVDVQLGGVCLGDDQAAQCAEILWNDAWSSSHVFTFPVDMANADLEPADVVTVPLQGTNYRVRITSIDDASQVLRTCTGSTDDDGNYVSDAVGVPPPYTTTMRFQSPTSLQLLDAPLLRDSDDTGRVNAPLYIAVAPTTTDTWAGAAIYDSSDGVSYGNVASESNKASMGVATTALGGTTNPFVTDTTNSVTIQMNDGAVAPSSITDDQLLEGFNAAALIDSSGDVEVLQFRDVLVVSPGLVTLSHLFRGRRGTESMTNGHEVGSKFVLLSSSTITLADMPLSALGKSYDWKALSLNESLAEVTPQTFTDTGKSLMPYAPWNPHAFVDPNGTIFVIAKRRARIGKPDWPDAETDTLALAEDYEEFSMDVYDAGGTSVVRTLTSTVLPVVYPSSLVTTDFGSIPSYITIALYQVSGEVGRGFASKQRLTVNPTSVYAPLVITTIELGGPIVGVSYSVSFEAAGGQPPYSWSMPSATPNTGTWMVMNSAGVLTGTPVVNETETFQVRVIDSAMAVTTTTYSLDVVGGTSSGTVSGGGTGGSTGGTGGTIVTGPITGAPFVGGVHNAGDQSYGWDTTPGITSYASAGPGTDAYNKTQDIGSYDVIWGLAAGFEGWETSTRKKQDLVTTLKGHGTYPNVKNASRTPYIFAYCIMESGKDVSSGSGYDRWISLVRSHDWWAYVNPGGSGTLLGAGPGGYCQINYAVAWPNAIVSVPKDTTIAGTVYGSLSNGQGPARTAARYFCSGLLVSATNPSLDSRFTGLANGASPDMDGLYLDNSFTSPYGGGPLSSLTASWDGISTQSNSAEAAYPSGVSSLLARGQFAFWDEVKTYLATCNPGKTYLAIGNFGEWFVNIDNIAAITGNAMAGVLSGGTVEEAFGTGGASLQYSHTFAQMLSKYYKMMDFLIAPKLLGLVIRLPAKDGSQTASWIIDGSVTTVSAGTAQEYQCMRAGLCFVLLEYGIATYACNGYDYTKYRWYDENGDDSLTQCNVKRGYLGKRIGARPTAAFFSNGVWLVEWDNGYSLFNPWGNGHQTITAADMAAKFPGVLIKCINGTQQHAINTGDVFASHTFGDPDGLILLKAGTTSTGGSSGGSSLLAVTSLVTGINNGMATLDEHGGNSILWMTDSTGGFARVNTNPTGSSPQGGTCGLTFAGLDTTKKGVYVKYEMRCTTDTVNSKECKIFGNGYNDTPSVYSNFTVGCNVGGYTGATPGLSYSDSVSGGDVDTQFFLYAAPTLTGGSSYSRTPHPTIVVQPSSGFVYDTSGNWQLHEHWFGQNDDGTPNGEYAQWIDGELIFYAKDMWNCRTGGQGFVRVDLFGYTTPGNSLVVDFRNFGLGYIRPTGRSI